MTDTNDNKVEPIINQKSYSAMDVANRFIDIFVKKGEKLSHKKLQKLVYLAYGFCLYKDNNKLIEQPFEAWPHGPVCRDLFFVIKGTQADPYNIQKQLDTKSCLTSDDITKIDQFVNYVMKYFGTWSANELENLTHKIGSAWDKVKNSENDEIELCDENIRIEISNIVRESK